MLNDAKIIAIPVKKKKLQLKYHETEQKRIGATYRSGLCRRVSCRNAAREEVRIGCRRRRRFPRCKGSSGGANRTVRGSTERDVFFLYYVFFLFI